MNNCLMVMSVRDADFFTKSVNRLNIPKVWFKGYTEYELNTHINQFIQDTNFDNYFIVSDDVLITPERFNLLQEALKKYEIVTGWGLRRQNLNESTILRQSNHWIQCQASNLPTFQKYNNYIPVHQVESLPEEFEVSFTGWFYTGIRRHIWLEYPYHTIAVDEVQGKNQYLASTDAQWSQRITAKNKYKQICIKAARTTHVSVAAPSNYYKWNFTDKKIIKNYE